MFRIESSIVIDAPVDTVFEWIDHPERHPEWQHSLLEVQHGGGTRHVEVRKFLGRRAETHYELVERVEGQRLRRKGRSGPGMPIAYTVDQEILLDPVAGGTQITMRAEIDTQGMLKAAAPAVARVSKHDQESQLAHLKELIEGHADLHEALAGTALAGASR